MPRLSRHKAIRNLDHGCVLCHTPLLKGDEYVAVNGEYRRHLECYEEYRRVGDDYEPMSGMLASDHYVRRTPGFVAWLLPRQRNNR